MFNGEWNLLHTKKSKIRVFLSRLTMTTYRKKEISRRTLEFSHYFSCKEIPSIYVNSSPSYLNVKMDSPAILSFDVFDKFDDFNFPDTMEKVIFELDIFNFFNQNIFNNLQNALNVYFYYKYIDLHPLYFSSFILFKRTRCFNHNFVLKYYPVVYDKELCIRCAAQNNFEIDYDSDNIKEGSLVLIPPYDNPFYVNSIRNDTINVNDFYQQKKEFKISKIKILILPKNDFLTSIFRFKMPDIDKFKYFNNFSFFSISKNSLIKFLNETNDEKSRKNIFNYYNSMPTFTHFLTEQINDETTYQNIFNTLSSYSSFPTPRCIVKSLPISTLTYYENAYNYDINPSKFLFKYMLKSNIHFDKIKIPFVTVKQKSSYINIPANSVIHDWRKQKYKPVFGEKSVQYVIFVDKSIPIDRVKCFIEEFKTIYFSYNFGKLTSYLSDDVPFQIIKEESISCIQDFLQNEKYLNYCLNSIVLFYIFDEYNTNLDSIKINLFYINSSIVLQPFNKKLKTLTFLLYSRIRNFFEHPDGINDYLKNKSMCILSELFFGYRYQHPFTLKIDEFSDEISLHVCWDTQTKISIFTDNSGTVLSKYEIKEASIFAQYFKKLKELFSDLKLKVSLFIFDEGLSQDNLETIKRLMDNDYILDVFTIFPSIASQFLTNKLDTDEDVYISMPFEISFPIERPIEKPLATCQVFTSQESYQISLYLSETSSPYELLRKTAEELSNLSWLSVLPNFEKRISGYPPHLANIIVHSSKVMRFSNFDFLVNKKL